MVPREDSPAVYLTCLQYRGKAAEVCGHAHFARLGRGPDTIDSAKTGNERRDCAGIEKLKRQKQAMVREDNAEAIGFYETLGLSRQKVVTLGRFLVEGEGQ